MVLLVTFENNTVDPCLKNSPRNFAISLNAMGNLDQVHAMPTIEALSNILGSRFGVERVNL